ncbi:MAG: solute carrier family 23 protein, partial [bacterium]|nr:solute carrier family 23 protein [bacterium]
MKNASQKVNWGQVLPLGFQHVFAMFGATVLVPLLTGLDPRTALFTSALGTLLFQLVTKGKVPAYLGSSFAFIAPLIAAKEAYGLPAALFGCITAGLVYVVFSAIIKQVGVSFIDRYLPPIVVGPVIMTIGLGLSEVAANMANANITVAMVTLAITIAVSYYGKGFIKIIPILSGIVGGYVFALFMHFSGRAELFNFTPVLEASWMPALPPYISTLITNPSATVLNPANWA